MLEFTQVTRRPLLQLFRAAVSTSAALFLATAAFGQVTGGLGSSSGNPMYQPAAVTGTVQVASTNAELHNVKVTLSQGSGLPVDAVFTDSRGNFAFMAVAAGSYVVTIDLEGYEPFREAVTVMGRPGPRVYAKLVLARDWRPAAPGRTVSARELALPQKAQEALHKGLDELYSKRNPAGSLIYFEQVIQAAPQFYEAYYNEGVAYLKLEKQDSAEAALRKSIELSNDNFADAYITLASMFADAGRFADAEPLARDGLGIQPESWRGHYELARALLGEGLPVDAEQSALEAKKRQPKFATLYILLANIELQLGRNESVIQYLDTYLKLDPTGPYSEQAKQLKEKTEKALGRTPTPPTPLQ